MNVSVILCTRNPRAGHLSRTLQALRQQTLGMTDWEFLVVDNASTPPLSSHLDLAWHPAARITLEPKVGLVHARLRGLAEAKGELLVFVDDDNVLAADFLAGARALAQARPRLGAFGGQIRGEFETPPRPWFAARLDRLAIREFSSATVGTEIDLAALPCGAGLCLRREAATAYRARMAATPELLEFGRRGTQLDSAEDTDLVLVVEAAGWEVGRFPELRLPHLIPPERLTLRYFARLTRGHARGLLVLAKLHPRVRTVPLWSARLAAWKWSVIDTVLSCLPSAPTRR